MRICMLTSSHGLYDNRIYYKEILSLKKFYEEIYIVAPGEKDIVTDDGIIIKTFKPRSCWYDRIRPMKDMFKIAKEIKADVYHGHEPDSAQVAAKLKRSLNCKAIYDSHEYHPEAFSEHFKFGKNLAQKMIYQYEKSIVKNVDCVITVNNLLVDKFKKYNKNVYLIPNYPVVLENNMEKNYDDKPTFIYVGGLREDRGILKIFEAIKLVKEDYKYIFVGPFENEDFKNTINEYINDNLKDKDIMFTGKIPHLEVFKYLNQSCAGFVLLQPSNWRYVNSEPIKIFEYMMTKTAVIASNFPMMKNIVDSSNCGLLVKPDETNEIANAIIKIGQNIENTKQMGINGYNSVLSKYNWNVCEKTLINAYKKLFENN